MAFRKFLKPADDPLNDDQLFPGPEIPGSTNSDLTSAGSADSQAIAGVAATLQDGTLDVEQPAALNMATGSSVSVAATAQMTEPTSANELSTTEPVATG